jgi:hypothetical protein
VKQLLHVYPLDAKTKEGSPFWSLPKRPPTPAVFDSHNALHQQFVTAVACLRAKTFRLKIPSEKPRSEEFRKEVGALASGFGVPEFVPDDSAAKEIQASVDKGDKEKEAQEKGKDGASNALDQEESKAEEQQPGQSGASDAEQMRAKFIELYRSLQKPP